MGVRVCLRTQGRGRDRLRYVLLNRGLCNISGMALLPHSYIITEEQHITNAFVIITVQTEKSGSKPSCVL